MATKTVYLYDATTGEYKGTYEAQESPLEPKVYLSPVHSIDIAPPTAGTDQVAVFASSAWTLESDYRGQTVYDQTSGASQEMTSIGAIPAGFALVPPPPTLTEARATQSTLMAAACQSAIEAGFTSSALGTANIYGCKVTDQANVNLAAIGGGSLWCANSAGVWAFTVHTAAQAIQVQKDMATHIQSKQSTYAKALSDIAAATTAAEVQMITWVNP
ncbi:MAG TPA: hypothetical protein PLK99_03645 [Burkholderiales bacterium]|nr:hypothetical protein [Burkholderiales bacterium]